MSEEFIKEVDEDLKEEKSTIGKNSSICLDFFGYYLITSGFVFWQNYTTILIKHLETIILLLDLANEKT